MRVAAWGPLASGTLLAVWAIGALAGAAIASRTVRGLGARRAAFAAALLVIAGLAGIAFWPATPHYALMISCLLLQGAGIGLFQVAYTDLVVAALPLSARGVAGSLTMVTRTIGIVLGASAWMWILQAVENAALVEGAAAQAAFMTAFGAVFQTASLAAGVFFALTCLRRRTWFGPGRT